MAFSGKEAKEIVEYLPLHKVYLLKSAIVRIMAKNTGSQSMNGSAPGSSVAGRTRSSTVDNLDAIEQLQSLTAKGKVPAYMKQIIELLMETRKEVRDLSQRNADLLEELRLLRQENVSLKEKLASFERARATVTNPSHLTQPDVSVKVDLDLDRSIVLSHVPESSSSKLPERLSHDFDYVVELLSYLNVECTPISVYRMGKNSQDRPRLIKVVLPSSKFQRLATRRAPRLRFSPTHKGIYLRPSLTWEERARRREQRQSGGGMVNDGSSRASGAREGCHSPIPTESVATSTPYNSPPTGNY